MAKVFRIHSQGASNQDWFASTEINSNLIDSIHTDSGDGKKLPTSIPSPFARIDLVRTAFATVANSGSLDGVTRNGIATASDNHKLISDALDIGQILFNFNKHKENLQLIAWDRTNSLNKLLNGNAQQRHLGKTLDLFLVQDSIQYNFDKFSKIYILKYKHRIIGGTSPRTLFFAAPDAKATDIKFGKDVMLDQQLLPLYQRDKEYIKYLYALSRTVLNFNTNFPEFNQYLVKTVSKLQSYDPNFHNELMNLDKKAYLRSLKDVVFNNNAGNPIDIIQDLPLKQFVKDPAIIENQSDFVINTTKNINGYKPLVLPTETLTAHYTYTDDQWDIGTLVPPEDIRPLNERTLPEQGDLYPYLTMNDFLTDTIIKLPYEINSDKFLTVGNKKFLLPIKKDFFNYFSVEDIVDDNLIETSDLAGDSIEVRLSIPIRKGYITYKKIYYAPSNISPNKDPKRGTIIQKSFALSIYPFVRSEDIQITYSVGIGDVDPNKHEVLDVDFINTTSIGKFIVPHKSKRSEAPLITQQNVIETPFDTIALKVGTVENIIIPRWREYTGNSGDNYEFAIDFGTTNSHIEYKIQGQGAEKAYDITESDEQIVFLMPSDAPRRTEAVRDVFFTEDYLKQEVIRERFGKDELQNSPFRTCLIENVNVNYAKPSKVFAEANIGFDYEQIPIRRHLKSHTDLKWSVNNDDNNKRIEHYIEELLILCKNKVLMNNGNLSNTRITWFYPVSMTTSQLKRFRRIWNERFEIIFNLEAEQISNYPESIAPFYYYKEKGNIRAQAKPSVSIDIGGGTTDVMIYADGDPKLITSFKFAGNAIFGDGFNGNINSNGFVQKYYQKIKDILKQNNLTSDLEILETINNSASSSDLVNYFFSLKTNKNIRDKEIDLDFAKMLADDDDLRIVFLLFFSSMIYHIAEMMKIKGMDTPRNILFSGTASKSLNIIDNDTRHESMTDLFEAIFNEVFGVDDTNITIKLGPKPKETTCKGGFYIPDDFNLKKHIRLVEFNTGNINDQRVQNRSDNKDNVIKFQDIDKDFISGVKENIENFYDLFDRLNTTLNFRDEFGISNESIQIFNEIKSDDLEDYIMTGLAKAKEDTDENEPISETLFFYALIGKLNELATEISEK